MTAEGIKKWTKENFKVGKSQGAMWLSHPTMMCKNRTIRRGRSPHRPKGRRKLRQSQYKRTQLLMPVEKNRRPNRPPALLIKLFNPLSDSQRDSHVIRNFLTFSDFFLADNVNNGELDFRDIFFTILGKFQQCRESVLAEA